MRCLWMVVTWGGDEDVSLMLAGPRGATMFSARISLPPWSWTSGFSPVVPTISGVLHEATAVGELLWRNTPGQP